MGMLSCLVTSSIARFRCRRKNPHLTGPWKLASHVDCRKYPWVKPLSPSSAGMRTYGMISSMWTHTFEKGTHLANVGVYNQTCMIHQALVVTLHSRDYHILCCRWWAIIPLIIEVYWGTRTPTIPNICNEAPITNPAHLHVWLWRTYSSIACDCRSIGNTRIIASK